MYEGKGDLGSGGTWQVTIRHNKTDRRPQTSNSRSMPQEYVTVISRIIEWCAHNRFLVFTGVLLLTLAGIWSMGHIPLDALPDISDVQVIIHTNWEGEPPTSSKTKSPTQSSLLCWLRRG